ncbi:MAG TPA: carboxymuconolactone decarboxylase family protein [Actinomycetota bacterium]|nr:carboxymuconolactone decarboxylase family protein [Actinomycetota bacterium]
MTPRIPPTTAAERDERTEELLSNMFRRPDGTDLNIFTTLAHHPKLLKRWAQFGGTLLFGGTLSGRDREMLILRTAWLCDAEYEWGQHVTIGLNSGLTEDEIERIHKEGAAGEWAENERALLQAADELHADHRISDETWKVLDSAYDYQQLIEICMVVGQYHMVAFTLNSLGIEPEPGLPEFPNKG